MSSQKEPCGCSCSSAPKLIFACSGTADVGPVSDLAAHRLNSNGSGKMFCLDDIGMKKVETEVSKENIGRVFDRAGVLMKEVA